MDPTGPSQPNVGTAYSTAANPVDQTEQEQACSAANAASNSGSLVDQREQGDIPVPSNHNEEVTPSSLAYGARDSSGDKEGDIGPHGSVLDGDQMHAPGEGEIYNAQQRKHGFGEQKDLASNLDTKKAEQSTQREQMKGQRMENVDVAGALGDRSGPSAVEGA